MNEYWLENPSRRAQTNKVYYSQTARSQNNIIFLFSYGKKRINASQTCQQGGSQLPVPKSEQESEYISTIVSTFLGTVDFLNVGHSSVLIFIHL